MELKTYITTTKEGSILKRFKSILGIMLILLSIGGLFLWEWKGREAILMDEVLVAAEEIQKGTLVDGSMFIVKGVPKENMLEGALTPGDMSILQGKAASQYIPKNNQIVMNYFGNNEFRLKQDESVFVIDPGWIAMRSSALRRGDVVDIYGTNGLGLLGTFRVVYVKDASEREVKDTGDGDRACAGSDILDRTDSTSVIDHVEIISTFHDYEYLVDCVSGTDGATPAALIIVQRGDRFDT